jgi:hypothetical protein
MDWPGGAIPWVGARVAPRDFPSTTAVSVSVPASGPRVAAMSKWARIEALTRNTHFLAAYVAAQNDFARGSRDVDQGICLWSRRP